MKKISKINWNRYKESENGKQAIQEFEKLVNGELTPEQLYQVFSKYNPEFTNNFGKKEIEFAINETGMFQDILSDLLDQNDDNRDISAIDLFLVFAYSWGKSVEDKDTHLTKFFDIFTETVKHTDKLEEMLDSIPEAPFKNLLSHIPALSVALSQRYECFIPYYFVMQFAFFKKIADKYELELPETDKRQYYYNRCQYYLNICLCLDDFAIENELSQAELCAFLYDYELPVVKEEFFNEEKEMPKNPEQAWFLVGNYGDGEKNMEHGFWQANELTAKGDVMVFFEKSPKKAINSVWTAKTEGVVDPFFLFYSNTYIGNKISIPEISYDELKQHPYFKDHALIRKNFQGGSGWPMNAEDYRQFLLILESKGFDTTVLPQLYQPGSYVTEQVSNEYDVYDKLLTPLLNDMGWVLGKDFEKEVEFKAGRGSSKRPDYCLHIKREGKDISTKVVIEAKYWMKNDNEIEENYSQGLSYAKWGNAKVLVICDKMQIRVYECDSKGVFNVKKWKRFRWEEMSNLDKFNELKRLLS